MPKLEMHTETALSPDQVVAALTDFTERRTEIWPGIAPELYEVYEVGETSAKAKEGSTLGPMKIWAVEDYDWSTPGVVTWTVGDSNFSSRGSYVRAHISPREGGGSKIRVEWEREPITFMARVIFRLMILTKGKAISDSMNKGLKKYESMVGGS